MAVLSWVRVCLLLAVGFSARAASAQEADRWDTRWESAWDRGFYQAAPPCSLDLHAGRHSRQGAEDWQFFVSFRLPLSGCRGQLLRASLLEEPQGDLAADERDTESPFQLVQDGPAEAERQTESQVPEALPTRPPVQAGRESERPSTFDAALVLEVVEHARAASGLAQLERSIAEQASRARASGLLPELRLRGAMGLDQSSSLSGAGLYPGESTLRGGTDTAAEVRLTFRLNRLLFDDAEPGLERLRLQLLAARQKVSEAALSLLFDWQRAERRSRDVEQPEEERALAAISAAELAMRLHVLTDGWFLRRLQSRGGGASGSAPHQGATPVPPTAQLPPSTHTF